MGQLVFILGRSGTGKSYSMRNFPKDKLAVINVQGKILPFKGSGQIEMTSVDRSEKIVDALESYSKKFKSIVVDDYQYTMANEFMRRSAERGYDKFTEIGRHAWDIASKVRDLPNDVIVYIMCHTDRDDEGNEKIKTIGKLLDEKICLEGMSTIVLKTNVADGVYAFLTQNNGKDTVKSPAGMFPSYAIDNDLWYVDQKIRSYYELGEFLTDEDMKEIDEAVKKDDMPISDGKKERRKRGKAKEEKPAETSEEEEKEETPAESATEEVKPKRGRRKKVVEEDNADDDDIPFYDSSVETPDHKPLPKRKKRATEDMYFETDGKKWMVKAGDPYPTEDSLKDAKQITKEEYDGANNTETEEAPKRRRRRKIEE